MRTGSHLARWLLCEETYWLLAEDSGTVQLLEWLCTQNVHSTITSLAIVNQKQCTPIYLLGFFHKINYYTVAITELFTRCQE